MCQLLKHSDRTKIRPHLATFFNCLALTDNFKNNVAIRKLKGKLAGRLAVIQLPASTVPAEVQVIIEDLIDALGDKVDCVVLHVRQMKIQ